MASIASTRRRRRRWTRSSLVCRALMSRNETKAPQTVGAGDDRVFDGEIPLPRPCWRQSARPPLSAARPLETGADRASLAIGQNDGWWACPARRSAPTRAVGQRQVDEADPPGPVDAEHAVVGGVENQAVLGHGNGRAARRIPVRSVRRAPARSAVAARAVRNRRANARPAMKTSQSCQRRASLWLRSAVDNRRPGGPSRQHIAPAKVDDLFQRGAEGRCRSAHCSELAKLRKCAIFACGHPAPAERRAGYPEGGCAGPASRRAGDGSRPFPRAVSARSAMSAGRGFSCNWLASRLMRCDSMRRRPARLISAALACRHSSGWPAGNRHSRRAGRGA